MTQPLTPEELTKLFQTIECEPTGKLSEIAKVAGLSLAEDYIGADLSGEDLSGDNLSYANLSNADLSNANLSNTDLSYVNLTDANLSNANLSNANLNNADLSNVNLSSANLSSATLSQANLNNANLNHANCRKTNLLHVKNLATASVFRTFLMAANLGLSKKEMSGLKLRGAIIDEARLINPETVSGRNINTGSGNYSERIQGSYYIEDNSIVSYTGSDKGQLRIRQYWRKRLEVECPQQSEASRETIIRWLVGSDSKRFDMLNPKELDIAKQAMEYRYRILIQRYLGLGRERAYRNLINRLASLVTLRNKIKTWVSLSRDRQRTVLDVLQEVLQELLQSDSYIQQQMAYVAGLTDDVRLQNSLLFAALEEYCLRPVRNQPLLVYRFVNYLRRTQRGGLTQVPASDSVKLISEELLTDDSDNRVNLMDSQVVAEYQEAQEQSEQQALRQMVKQEFENYLLENLGSEAVQWLKLYLQGKSQDEIAKKLNKETKEVYRLREKISYHAIRVFGLKNQPELVENWLSISAQEHNFGLTQKQFGVLMDKLTAIQRQILELRKGEQAFEAIAQQLKLKSHQVISEWTKVYLVAQALKNQE